MMRMKPEQWQDVIDTNLSSVFYATQARVWGGRGVAWFWVAFLVGFGSGWARVFARREGAGAGGER
jgi:NAD(P)-dependent dehydrogenase (short-subunit alcohol dehydrogenase family)